MKQPRIVPMIVLYILAAALPVAAAQNRPEPLNLDDAVQLYIDRNLQVEAARLEVEQARAGQIAAQLRPNPGITVTAENFRLSGPTAFDNLYEIAVSYSETLELGGKRRLRTDVADLSVEVAEAQLSHTLRQGIAEVKRLYYESLLARENIAAAVNNRDAFDRLVAYNVARFEEGAASQSDLIKVRLERMRFDDALRLAELDLRQKIILLVERIGDSNFDDRTVMGELTFQPVALDLNSLKAAALDNRPDVRAARLNLERARAQLALEGARSTPDVTTFVGYKRVASSNTILFGVSMPLPFRDQNQGGIARATRTEQIAQAQLGAIQNRALAEVESAFAAYEMAEQQAALFQNELLGQAGESQQIALVAYQEGATQLHPLLEAQRTEAEVRRRYHETLVDYHKSIINMELAVGREVGP